MIHIASGFVLVLCGIVYLNQFNLYKSTPKQYSDVWRRSNISTSTLFPTSYRTQSLESMNIATYVWQNAISTLGWEKAAQRESTSRAERFHRQGFH